MRAIRASLAGGLIVVVGFCGAVVAVGLRLAEPRNTVVGPPPADLAFAEPVTIRSGSGAWLHGWWLANEAKAGAVVLIHGVWSDRRTMLRRARVLHDRGFAVLLFDLQAEGESPGTHISFGKLEALDAAAATAFTRERSPNQRVGLIGVSLGGAAALLGPRPLVIDALVLESVYADIGSALANRLRAALGPIAGPVFVPFLTPAFELLLPPILGVTADELRPIDHIGEVTAPILIISGAVDDRTPIDEARRLFDRAPEPKQLVAVPGASHADLERYDSEAYWRIVMPFLIQHLRPDRADP